MQENKFHTTVCKKLWQLIFYYAGVTTAQQKIRLKKNRRKWMDWMTALNEKGKFAGAQPLKPGGKLIKGLSKQVTDDPFMEGNEMADGYLVCKAASYEEAMELSKNCPVFIYESGIVEIKEIQDLEM